MRTIRVGGFFTGIGAHVSACDRITGEREGIRFEHIFSCEFDEKTAQAFDVMHSNHPPIRNLGDITKVHNIGGDLRVDILFTTPPCQDLSLAGRQAGCAQGSGTRSSLMFETPRILRNTPRKDLPKWIVMEEVPMLISKKFRPFFLELLAQMTDLGYQHEFGIINAADMGVAQSRRRMFCISRLGAPAPKLPEPIPLDKCLRDYLEPEPVDPSYYLSEDRIKGLVWSNQKEEEAGNNFRFQPTTGGGTACTVTSRAGQRKTDNFLQVSGMEWK